MQPVTLDKTQPSIQTQPPRVTAWPWWSLASLALLALILLACGITSLAFATRISSAEVWPTVVLHTVTPRPAPTYVVVTGVPTPAAQPSAAGKVRVTGTAGLSLRLRAAPSTNAETVKLVPDGTLLLITGDSKQAEGYTWWPVRDPSDNKEGWAVSQYLTLP